jgi:SAM-dependent methyltransferase
MSSPTYGDRAGSFGRGAGAYRRTRPGYPPDAVDWLLGPGPTRVLDLAAGTGKMTENLVGRGLDVVAVEPADGMRAELADVAPTADVRAGTAEHLPLPDADVDAVLVAQAWHWFDPRTASGEISRVLRPGGRLGVVWNIRDDEVDWVGQLTGILHTGDPLQLRYDRPELDDRWTAVEHATFRWQHRLAPGDLRVLALSRSHTLTLDPDDRDALLDAVDDLTRTHPDLAGRDAIDLPYRTECYRADLR